MWVYLSKLLPQLVYPVGIASLFLFIALFRIRKHPKSATWLMLITFIMILVGGNRIVSAALTRSLENRYPAVEKLPDVDAIVLLGGGTESPDTPRQMTELNGAGDRILYAAELYHQGLAPKILLSGGNLQFNNISDSTPASEMKEILLKLDVPKKALWIEDKSQNTEENALFSATILKEKGIRTIILVTSAIHMPRAVQLFEAQGILVIPAPADFTLTDALWAQMISFEPEQIPFNLIPSSSALNQTTTALKEYLGMTVNIIKGWKN